MLLIPTSAAEKPDEVWDWAFAVPIELQSYMVVTSFFRVDHQVALPLSHCHDPEIADVMGSAGQK